jgi:hypothetical protein
MVEQQIIAQQFAKTGAKSATEGEVEDEADETLVSAASTEAETVGCGLGRVAATAAAVGATAFGALATGAGRMDKIQLKIIMKVIQEQFMLLKLQLIVLLTHKEIVVKTAHPLQHHHHLKNNLHIFLLECLLFHKDKYIPNL